jgi:hypothetical protein
MLSTSPLKRKTGGRFFSWLNVNRKRTCSLCYTNLPSDKGYSSEGVYEDKIKNRQLFGSRKNKNPEGMKAEYLLILNKV